MATVSAGLEFSMGSFQPHLKTCFNEAHTLCLLVGMVRTTLPFCIAKYFGMLPTTVSTLYLSNIGINYSILHSKEPVYLL